MLHDFDKREIFEGCMPVEVMAARGFDSLRFANLKPVGYSACRAFHISLYARYLPRKKHMRIAFQRKISV